jgi:hypothetical protein
MANKILCSKLYVSQPDSLLNIYTMATAQLKLIFLSEASIAAKRTKLAEKRTAKKAKTNDCPPKVSVDDDFHLLCSSSADSEVAPSSLLPNLKRSSPFVWKSPLLNNMASRKTASLHESKPIILNVKQEVKHTTTPHRTNHMWKSKQDACDLTVEEEGTSFVVDSSEVLVRWSDSGEALVSKVISYCRR